MEIGSLSWPLTRYILYVAISTVHPYSQNAFYDPQALVAADICSCLIPCYSQGVEGTPQL